MTLLSLQNEIFLTRGGISPQLILWNYKTNNFIKISYPQFNSIYALAIEPGIMGLAAGTRNGLIYFHALDQVKNKKLPLKTTLIHGSPILSICWLDDGLLAVSDKAGRCVVWDIERKVILQSLETRTNIICSLVYKNKTLYGLSMNARLFLWDIKSQKQFSDIAIPHLPKMGSLVNFIFWPANNTLVFPGNEGKLSLFNIDTAILSTFEAHDGNIYSIYLYEEDLISFGIKDHQCKIWSKNTNYPASSYPIDKKIISSVGFSSQQDRFLLIDFNGYAYEHVLEPQGLKFIQQLPGKDYRICTSLSPEISRQLKEDSKKNKAHEITDKILKCTDQVSDKQLAGYYDELNVMGFNHIRLALQADHAEKKDNLFKAITFSLELLCLIPEGNIETCSTMEQHVNLLEKTWNLTEAFRISKKILKIDPINICAKRIIKLCSSSGLHQNSWIIEPDIPLDVVLKSAAAVKNIGGRYVIKTLDKIICEKIILTPELIVKKYEELRFKKNMAFEPKVMIEHAQFFSNKENQNIMILSFSSDDNLQYLQFAIKVICSGSSGTTIIPIILLDCRYHHIKNNSENNDIDIFSIFMNIKQCPSSSMYLRQSHALLHHILKRLITQKTARGKFKNGF